MTATATFVIGTTTQEATAAHHHHYHHHDQHSHSVRRHWHVSREARLSAADTVASWAAFVAGLSFAHPFDTLRVRLQTRGQHPLSTIRVDGFRSLYAGFSAPALGNGPVVAATFGTAEAAKRVLADRGGLRGEGMWSRVLPGTGYSAAETFVAGTIAGTLTTQVLSPLNVLRVQQQHAAGARVSMLSAARSLHRADGCAGFFRAHGLGTLVGGVGRGVYLASYDVAKDLLGTATGGNGGAFVDVAAALCSTTLWLALVFPFDSVATRVIADSAAPLHLRRFGGSSFACAAASARCGILRGFYAGFSLALVRSAVWSGIQLPAYDLLRPRARDALGASAPHDEVQS